MKLRHHPEINATCRNHLTVCPLQRTLASLCADKIIIAVWLIRRTSLYGIKIRSLTPGPGLSAHGLLFLAFFPQLFLFRTSEAFDSQFPAVDP